MTLWNGSFSIDYPAYKKCFFLFYFFPFLYDHEDIFQAKHMLMANWVVFVCVFLQDIFKQATEDRLTSAKELPYFEGDFWPNVLEESIKELEQEEEERKREENSTSNESVDVSL